MRRASEPLETCGPKTVQGSCGPVNPVAVDLSTHLNTLTSHLVRVVAGSQGRDKSPALDNGEQGDQRRLLPLENAWESKDDRQRAWVRPCQQDGQGHGRPRCHQGHDLRDAPSPGSRRWLYCRSMAASSTLLGVPARRHAPIQHSTARTCLAMPNRVENDPCLGAVPFMVP